MTTGTRPSATFEVPAGTTDVFVQIANKGDTDGAYDNLTIELTPARPSIAARAPTPSATLRRIRSPTTESESGCGCSVPGRSPAVPASRPRGRARSRGRRRTSPPPLILP